LQIELKRTLYMDEDTLVPNAGYAKLQRDLSTIASELARYIRKQIGRAT